MKMSGLTVGAPKFSLETTAKIIEALAFVRPTIKLPEDAEKGSRFNSDPHVLWLIESGATEEEVIAQPYEAARLGLIEAAKSDHWYNHEKQWEDDDVEEVEDEDYHGGYDYND